MSFIYPRTINITRPAAQSSVGLQGYGGQAATTETVVASGISAAVQFKRASGSPTTKLPGDSARLGYWEILFLGRSDWSETETLLRTIRACGIR